MLQKIYFCNHKNLLIGFQCKAIAISSNLNIKGKIANEAYLPKYEICGTMKMHHVHVHELLFAIWGAIFNIRNAF